MATGTAVDVVMPQMGVSVSEGTITRWLKQVGEQVEADESLLEISTDKVDTEVPAPASGVVSEILVQEGETVAVGTLLARIGGEASAPAEAPPAPATQEAADASEAKASEGGETEPPSHAAPPQPAPEAEPEGGGNGRAFVSPVVARIAGEHGIDPSQVPGSGTGGRVTKKDILAFIEQGAPAPAAPEASPAPQAAPAAPAAPQPAPAAQPAPAPAPAVAAQGESLEPMSAM